VFYKDSRNIFRVEPLDRFTWLEHGFGTRHSGIPEDATTLKQVHSADCVVASGRTGCLGQGDGLVESTPGRQVAVKTADCIPLLMADVEHRVVAAVHAGWRGTAQHIAEAAIALMARQFGTRPEDLHVAIGPGIGPCCYEVGPEVAAELGAGNERTHVDLAGINAAQLRRAGVAQVYTAGLCTRCLADEFYSFRREGEKAGRMYSAIGVK
jgi:hypothetical protein